MLDETKPAARYWLAEVVGKEIASQQKLLSDEKARVARMEHRLSRLKDLKRSLEGHSGVALVVENDKTAWIDVDAVKVETGS